MTADRATTCPMGPVHPVGRTHPDGTAVPRALRVDLLAPVIEGSRPPHQTLATTARLATDVLPVPRRCWSLR